MNRVTYTVFVAFVSSVLTLVVVWAVTPGDDRAPAAGGDDLREITMEELARHDSAGSCWKAIDGRVYDVTEYIPRHPTPESVILRWCGREATEGWDGIGGGRGHSAAAAAMLRDFVVGRLVNGDRTGRETADTARRQPAPEPRGPEPEGVPGSAPDAAGRHADGRYRGTFGDRGYQQVSIEFHLRDGVIEDLTFRHLYYAGEDYLGIDEDHPLYPVFEQHLQIAAYLEGRPLSAIDDLYTPEAVVDDIDGFTGATLRASKVISAMRDALNRGIY